MTAPVSNIPVSVDYTSRDYYALREDLIDLVKARVNSGSSKQWSGEDPSDFGLALIEAFAYIGDLTNYYIDRIANETYLPTATQRKNILNIARLYGYAPTGFRAAQLQVEFTNSYTTDVTNAVGNGTLITYTAANDFVVVDVVTISAVTPSGFNLSNKEVVSCTPTNFAVASTFSGTYVSDGVVGKIITIPEGTQVSGSVIKDDVVEEVIFTTLETVDVPAATETTVGTILSWSKNGEDIRLRPGNEAQNELDIAGELIGTSNGFSNQTYILTENEVVTEDIEIYVEAGDIYEPWQQVTNLIDYGPSDAVYRAELDENNFVSIIFGDGISGAIPNTMSGIKAVYYAGGGTIGNVSAGIIDTIDYIPNLTSVQLNSLSEFISVGNPRTVGIGGSEPEDNFSIRTNAALAVRSNNRVVSFQDYESLALFVGNVGKANATAAVWTSVTLYVAPVRNQGDLDKFPGFDGANDQVTAEWLALRDSVLEYFEGKTLIGSSLQVSPPTYTPVSITVVFTKNDNYTSEQAEDDIKKSLVTTFGYANLNFEETVTPELVESILIGLPSVKTSRVTNLYRTGQTPQRAALIGSPAEIFVFLESGITVTELSNNAQLSALTASSGTLSPALTSDFYAYNLTGVSASTVTLTPVGATGSTITVNGVSAATPVTLGAVGSTTTVSIVVIAPDGTTVRVYTVSIYRVAP